MSVVRLLVLGIVRMHGRAHGYVVHRELLSWKVETWTPEAMRMSRLSLSGA